MPLTLIEDFDDNLKNLQRQVSQFASGEAIDIEMPKNNSILSKININSNMVYYVLLPIIIMIALYLFKPCFIMTETTTDNSLSSVKKIDLKKMLISTIVTTCIISLIIFSYKYKKPV